MTSIPAEEAREELITLMHAWTAAVGAKDQAYFDRHVDERWRYIDYTGAQRGIAEYLVLIQDVASYTEEFRRFDVRIVAGNVALCTGAYVARVDFHGAPRLEKPLAFTSVWEKRDGVWKALLHHTTSLPA